ncbi:MAG TPA: serine/threonine-protein kinase [Chitinispirillaceae bacterium]|nr:serine/threonine-protein kinase [Chitinispirillaceae bacterium]
MATAELETSGLMDNSDKSRMIALPDGKEPVQLGSGLVSGILGEGGSSILYEIHNVPLGFQRAVKLLKPNHTRESFERFFKEFRIGAQLNHPNIIVVHHVGQWHGLPYIEMEKISGFSLAEIITQFAPLPTGLCTALGIILCKILEYLEDCTFELKKKKYKGLLHLDIKPSNILLSELGAIKLMDFGLATPLQEPVANGKILSGIGSPQYSAPEVQFGTDTPDTRADIFSLGCILYEMITGTKTFKGSTSESVIESRKNEGLIPLKKIAKNVPSELIDLVDRCLSFEKEFRPANSEKVRLELEKIHQKLTQLTPENTVTHYIEQRKRNEPFSLPKVNDHSKQTVVLASTTVLTFCVVVILFFALFKPAEFNNTLFSITSLLAPTPLHQTAAVSAVESKSQSDTYFYAPSNDTESKMLDALRAAWSQRKFDEMLNLITTFPPELLNNKEVILYRLRASGRGGEDLGILLNDFATNDGEFFFHKARHQYGLKEYNGALEALNQAETNPSEFLDKRILGQEIQLYRSRCLTSLFRENPSSDNLTAALNAWDRLIVIVQDKPESMQSKEALREKKNLLAEAEWRGFKQPEQSSGTSTSSAAN